MTGTQGGTIRGNLYELDYQQHFRHVVEASQPVSVNRLFYEHGTRDIPDGQYFDGSPDRVSQTCGLLLFLLLFCQKPTGTELSGFSK